MEGWKMKIQEGEYCSKLLELAATDDLSSFIQQVERRGCDIDEASFWYGRRFGSKKMEFQERTPIMIAALYGSTRVLKYIIHSNRIDVNRAVGSDGATPIHCAAAGGSAAAAEALQLLISASAEVSAVDADGRRPADLIPPCVRRRALEAVLSGVEEVETAVEDRKEYPAVELPLPDINGGVYGTDEFRMYSFKVNPCSRAYSHDWTECPFVHPGENARRRDPTRYTYTCVPCPDFKKGSCGKGDACEYAHGVFESWLHPALYRTRLCKDDAACSRKVCFFAHKHDELRPVYASTGSGMPSPSNPDKSGKAAGVMLPALQLSGGRLKTSVTSRDFDLDQSSLYTRIRDLNPAILDGFGSIDPARISHLQSPGAGRQNLNKLRSSYLPSPYGFDSAAAMAAAVTNSRSSAFVNRSQSFVDRSGGNNYRSASMTPSKLSEWGAPGGKLEWGFNDEEANKLRKSASFGIRSGGAAVPRRNATEPDVSWVNSVVSGGGNEVIRSWMDQMYLLEHKQMVA